MSVDIDIIQFLRTWNPWWTTNEVPGSLLERFKRRDFYVISERIEERQILSLTGLRRVGKTTLIYQLIDHLLTELHIPAKNILFISLENPYLKTLKVPFQSIMALYGKSIVGHDIFDLTSEIESQPIYVFLDEVHYWPDWERELKVIYDRKIPIKFIVSGSSSLHLHSKSSESLVGRIDHQLIFPFKFLEICRFTCQNDKPKDIQAMRKLNEFNWEFRGSIKTSVLRDSLTPITSFLDRTQPYWIIQSDFWKRLLDDYLVRGGFPETFSQDLARARNYIRTFIELVIHKDVRDVYWNIRHIDKFKQLFLWITRESSSRSNIISLAKNIGIDRDTIQKYLEALESVYLVNRSPYYTRSTSKVIRSQIKFYVTDIGVQSAYLNLPLQIHSYDGETLGKVVETLVSDHIRRLKFNLEFGLSTALYYWYDRKQRQKEVDIVFELSQKPIPVEVKYQNKVDKRDLKGIRRFQDIYPESPFGIVVSKDTLDYSSNEKIIILPLWLFLIAP
ncbi:MAG: ATP-binding protein [Candidatus Thorarchaeota archaeon]